MEKQGDVTWSKTWLFVVLYFSAMASATALVPRKSVFQLCELKQKKKSIHLKDSKTKEHKNFNRDVLT